MRKYICFSHLNLMYVFYILITNNCSKYIPFRLAIIIKKKKKSISFIHTVSHFQHNIKRYFHKRTYF